MNITSHPLGCKQSDGEDTEEEEPSSTDGGNRKWGSYFGKQHGS